MTANEEIVSPTFDSRTGQCNRGWVCEHRWPEIRKMINFRNVAQDAPVSNWWDNDGDQIAFCRGTRGFIAINNAKTDMNVKLNTCLPRGVYCDVFSGALVNNKCTGEQVEVDEFSQAQVAVSTKLGVLAIHMEVIHEKNEASFSKWHLANSLCFLLLLIVKNYYGVIDEMR